MSISKTLNIFNIEAGVPILDFYTIELPFGDEVRLESLHVNDDRPEDDFDPFDADDARHHSINY